MRVADVQPHGARVHALEQRHQPVDVHRLVEAVVDRLAHQRVVGDLDGPGGGVLLAAGQRREHRRHEVVGLHALDGRRVACRPPRWRSTTSARSRFQRQRTWNIGESEQRLGQRLRGRRRGREKCGTSSSGKLCCGPSDSTMASSLAAAWSSKSKRRQKRLRSARPRARLIRPPNGRVDDELHAARLVEEALEHHVAAASAPRRARRASRRDRATSCSAAASPRPASCASH